MRYLFYIFLIFAFHCRALPELPEIRIKITSLTDKIAKTQNEHDLHTLKIAKDLFERMDSIYSNICNNLPCEAYNIARDENMPKIDYASPTFIKIKKHGISQVEELKSHILNGHYHAFAVGFSFFVRNYGEFSGVNSEQEIIRKLTKKLLDHIMKKEFYGLIEKDISGSSCIHAWVSYGYERTGCSVEEKSSQISAINSFWRLINVNGFYYDRDNKPGYTQFPIHIISEDELVKMFYHFYRQHRKIEMERIYLYRNIGEKIIFSDLDEPDGVFDMTLDDVKGLLKIMKDMLQDPQYCQHITNFDNTEQFVAYSMRYNGKILEKEINSHDVYYFKQQYYSAVSKMLFPLRKQYDWGLYVTNWTQYVYNGGGGLLETISREDEIILRHIKGLYNFFRLINLRVARESLSEVEKTLIIVEHLLGCDSTITKSYEKNAEIERIRQLQMRVIDDYKRTTSQVYKVNNTGAAALNTDIDAVEFVKEQTELQTEEAPKPAKAANASDLDKKKIDDEQAARINIQNREAEKRFKIANEEEEASVAIFQQAFKDKEQIEIARLLTQTLKEQNDLDAALDAAIAAVQAQPQQSNTPNLAVKTDVKETTQAQPAQAQPARKPIQPDDQSQEADQAENTQAAEQVPKANEAARKPQEAKKNRRHTNQTAKKK